MISLRGKETKANEYATVSSLAGVRLITSTIFCKRERERFWVVHKLVAHQWINPNVTQSHSYTAKYWLTGQLPVSWIISVWPVREYSSGLFLLTEGLLFIKHNWTWSESETLHLNTYKGVVMVRFGSYDQKIWMKPHLYVCLNPIYCHCMDKKQLNLSSHRSSCFFCVWFQK